MFNFEFVTTFCVDVFVTPKIFQNPQDGGHPHLKCIDIFFKKFKNNSKKVVNRTRHFTINKNRRKEKSDFSRVGLEPCPSVPYLHSFYKKNQ